MDVTTDSIVGHPALPLTAITEVGEWEEVEVPQTGGTELRTQQYLHLSTELKSPNRKKIVVVLILNGPSSVFMHT